MKTMNIIAATNTMKGSLSAAMSAESIARGVDEAFRLFSKNVGFDIKYNIIKRPVADGGDDTLDAVADTIYENRVTGPFGSPISARWGSIRNEVAVIEMAKASGIALVPPSQLNPFIANTYGTGELISEAIKKGFKEILLTIGGSATVEGGIGAISALGAKFYDKNKKLIEKPFGNSILGEISDVELNGIRDRMKNIKISIACDVDNPLLGPNGASKIFGTQKLAPKEREPKERLSRNISNLERNMKNFSDVLKRQTGRDIENKPGSGAAGGFPLAFCSLLDDVKLERGSKLVLEMTKFHQIVEKCKPDIVITCEGRCDTQTLHGKGPYAVCEAMKGKGAHVIMLCGEIEAESVEKGMIDAGANVVSSIVDGPESLGKCVERTDELLRRATFRNVYSYLSARHVLIK